MVKRVVLLLIVPLLVVACQNEGGQGVSELPTELLLPSLTPTDTPTETPPMTNTPSDTPTLTATPGPSLTPTNTLTSTATTTNTATATNTATETFTPLPATETFTPTATSTATETPTVTPTPGAPVIVSFSASSGANTVDGGTNIALNWQTTNATSARIDQFNAQGVLINTTSVIPNGTLNVAVPNSGNFVVYRLTAIGVNNQEVSQSITINIRVLCANQWFFSNSREPLNGACPDGPPVTTGGKLQEFERGLMLSGFFSGQNLIFALINGGTFVGSYAAYTNFWDGVSEPTSDCGEAPPGFLNPEDVFRWVYHTQPSIGTRWCDPVNGIGWARANANLDTVFTGQGSEAPSPFYYLEVPGFGLVQFNTSASTWTFPVIPDSS